jgi:hypothetical protein
VGGDGKKILLHGVFFVTALFILASFLWLFAFFQKPPEADLEGFERVRHEANLIEKIFRVFSCPFALFSMPFLNQMLIPK